MSKTKFIALSTQKGGAGKTTLTVLLASHLHYTKGYKVAIIDCDYPQHSILEMRTRDKERISNDPHYKLMAYNLFEKCGKRSYIIIDSKFEEAIDKAKALCEAHPDLDYIFFDLPGTVNIRGLLDVICGMDYIFTPIVADKVVFESSLRFATAITNSLISTGKISVKALYVVWNMVDRREKSELYETFDKILNEFGIPIMETMIPDSKRFRRELSETHRPVFRSTLFPIDRKLLRTSGIEEFTTEFLQITQPPCQQNE